MEECLPADDVAQRADLLVSGEAATAARGGREGEAASDRDRVQCAVSEGKRLWWEGKVRRRS